MEIEGFGVSRVPLNTFSDKYVNSTPLVSFLFLYGVEFTYLSLNCFFRNTDAAHTSLPLVIFPLNTIAYPKPDTSCLNKVN